MQSSKLPVRTIDIGTIIDTHTGHIAFDNEEREAIATLLGLSSLDSLRMDYTITPLANDRFGMSGRFVAELSQPCVVTLEPVSEVIDEAIEAELWPSEQIEDTGAPEAAEDEPAEQALPDEPPIPIVAGKADLAAYAIEILSTTMTAYPRKENVEFDWQDPASGPEGRALGPFAELGKLKTKS